MLAFLEHVAQGSIYPPAHQRYDSRMLQRVSVQQIENGMLSTRYNFTQRNPKKFCHPTPWKAPWKLKVFYPGSRSNVLRILESGSIAEFLPS